MEPSWCWLRLAKMTSAITHVLPAEITTEDPEHRALKKRKLEAETVRLELENSKMLQDMQIDTIKT